MTSREIVIDLFRVASYVLRDKELIRNVRAGDISAETEERLDRHDDIMRALANKYHTNLHGQSLAEFISGRLIEVCAQEVAR